MKKTTLFGKLVSMAFLLFSVMLISSCVTTTNPDYTTRVNVEASDLILGHIIRVDGNFSNSEVESGYALGRLTAKALKDTDYDLIFMPRLERSGLSKVTLIGRPAGLR